MCSNRKNCDIAASAHIHGMDDEITQLGLIDEADIVLDEAALSLALPDNPETYLDRYCELLGEIAARLRDVGAAAGSAHERADALSLVLAEEFGFRGDEATYDAPANADMIRVIDRRRGLPISLSILYVAAARRVGWTANALDVPGHVPVLIGDPDDLVIVDPFRGGVLVGQEQLIAMASTSVPPGSNAVQIAAMPNRAILVRLMLNQARRAEDAGKAGRALEIYRRMTEFAPDAVHLWWQRARLELIDHDVGAARRSLAAMLELTREPALRATITEMLHSLVAS